MLEIFLRVYDVPFVAKVKGREIVFPTEGKAWSFSHNFSTDKLDKLITVRQNSLGFRGEEPPEDFPDKLTIIAIGGSTTYNTYISDGKTWIDVLGNKLKNVFSDVWINNAGFNGHSTEAHILLMEQHISKLRPDIVLFLVGTNDSFHPGKIGIDIGGTAVFRNEIKEQTVSNILKAAYKRREEAYSIKFRFKIYFKKFLNFSNRAARYSEVFATALTAYRNYKAYNQGLVYGEADIEDQAETIEVSEEHRKIILERMQSDMVRNKLSAYETRLKKLVRLCRDYGITPVFITQPALYGNAIDDVTGFNWAKYKLADKIILDGELYWKVEEMINDVTRKVAADEDLLLVELARKLPKSSKYFIDVIHYSNKGNEKVAEIIYDTLCPYMTENYSGYAKGNCLAPSDPPK